MKVSARTEWPFWVLIAAIFLASAIAWPMVPERFPMHYNLHGQIDRWGTRSQAAIPLLLLPGVCVGIYLFLLFLPRIDPGRANYGRFQTAYWAGRFVVLAHLAVLHAVVLLNTLGYTVDIARIMLMSLGVLFIVLGSIMGKIRPNWFVGIRTPWTLSSKLSWTHTHRAGGWTFIVLGLFTLAAALLRTPWNLFAILVAIMLATLGLVLYSYLVWRRDPERLWPSGTAPAEEESAENQSLDDSR